MTAFAQPGVLLFPALGTTSAVVVSGRVLREAPSEGTSNWAKNLRNLTASTWEDAPVDVGFDGQHEKVKSGEDGVFEVTFHAPKDRPYQPGTFPIEARVPDGLGRATVTILANDAPYFIVSDFDDTIAVTNVLEKTKLLDTTFFKTGASQPVVKGMPEFYRCLMSDKKSAPGFALVSGSPLQFHWRILPFLAKNGFPPGGVYLRDLGPKTLTDYKQPVIRALLSRIPTKVILVGDSGEHDPEVYSQIRSEFPDRVLAIYIHDVGRDQDPKRFEGMVLFKDPKEASKDAVSRGYETEGCHDESFGGGK